MIEFDNWIRPAWRALAVGVLIAAAPVALTAPAEDAPEQPADERTEARPEGAGAADRADQAADAPADGEAPAGKPGAARKGEDPGVFVPSEEISEDFAVAFPVDI